MNNKINWGILGCGKIAHKFASDLRLVPAAKLYAVASRDAKNEKEFADKYGADIYYDNYESLAGDPNVHVIYIATPHNFHHAHTLLCLNHNKAVLCEKPFAINSREVNEMINIAKEKNVFLMEALWSKFLPHYKKLLQLVKEDKLGKIMSVLINFGFKPKPPIAQRIFDPKLGGGTIMDIGIYNVFFALSILGKPDEIKAEMTPSQTGVDEQCAVLFKYKDGAMAQLFSSFSSNLPTEATISGSKGSIKLTNRFYEPSATIEYFTETIKEKSIIEVERSEGFGYQYEAQHVTDCLLNGIKESTIMSFDDSIILMETLDTIRKKAGIKYPADE